MLTKRFLQLIAVLLMAGLIYVGLTRPGAKVYLEAPTGPGDPGVWQRAREPLLVQGATIGAAKRDAEGRLLGEPSSWTAGGGAACPT